MSASYTTKLPVWLDLIFAWPVLVFRRLKYGYPYRKIYLGEGEWTIIDPEDYYAFGRFKWIYFGARRNSYAVRNVKTGPVRTKMVYLHREIMKAPKGFLVDHRNGDGRDNRRANLRLATHSQNSCNRAKRSNVSSKYFGVYLDKERRLWGTSIKHNGRTIYLGRFDNEIAAARAHDNAAREYHKEFARLNFPEDT